jgi:hypothetical protein
MREPFTTEDTEDTEGKLFDNTKVLFLRVLRVLRG